MRYPVQEVKVIGYYGVFDSDAGVPVWISDRLEYPVGLFLCLSTQGLKLLDT